MSICGCRPPPLYVFRWRHSACFLLTFNAKYTATICRNCCVGRTKCSFMYSARLLNRIILPTSEKPIFYLKTLSPHTFVSLASFFPTQIFTSFWIYRRCTPARIHAFTACTAYIIYIDVIHRPGPVEIDKSASSTSSSE